MNPQLKKRYQNYSDDKLILILSEEDGAYTQEAKKVAEALLQERGYEITYEEESSDIEPPLDEILSPDELVKQDTLVSETAKGFSDRVNSLIDDIEEEEEEQIEALLDSLETLSDVQLIEKYGEILNQLFEHNELELTGTSPILETKLRSIIEGIDSRSLLLPDHLTNRDEKIRATLNKKTMKSARRKRNFNLILGGFLLIFSLALIGDNSGVRVSLFTIFLAIRGIYVGIRTIPKARRQLL